MTHLVRPKPSIWQKASHERQNGFLKIMCTLAKISYFRPVPTDSRYKLLKYADAFFLAWNPNVMIIFPVCNDMFPRCLNCLNSIGLIIRSNNPGFGTITRDDNTGIICFFEPCGKKSFEVRHVPCHRNIMPRARKGNRAGIPPVATRPFRLFSFFAEASTAILTSSRL